MALSTEVKDAFSHIFTHHTLESLRDRTEYKGRDVMRGELGDLRRSHPLGDSMGREYPSISESIPGLNRIISSIRRSEFRSNPWVEGAIGAGFTAGAGGLFLWIVCIRGI